MHLVVIAADSVAAGAFLTDSRRASARRPIASACFVPTLAVDQDRSSNPVGRRTSVARDLWTSGSTASNHCRRRAVFRLRLISEKFFSPCRE